MRHPRRLVLASYLGALIIMTILSVLVGWAAPNLVMSDFKSMISVKYEAAVFFKPCRKKPKAKLSSTVLPRQRRRRGAPLSRLKCKSNKKSINGCKFHTASGHSASRYSTTSLLARHLERPRRDFSRVIEEKGRKLIFVQSSYIIETVEAERISLDHVAHLKPSDGGSAATQLVAHLTGIHSAIKMLNSKIKVLHHYLLAMQKGKSIQIF
ncbi:unnamed protein product [Fraxinus pennsylvanica]|uniref:EIF3F/CSN6-like C-terminal domain-containing protein n=1 Tax=Fraxinus pennsylvanica TaxID=56036 RepID=A0AAD2ED64_9LAMI|nr:unnamed protein product [Fraxinus pennsylvanica]